MGWRWLSVALLLEGWSMDRYPWCGDSVAAARDGMGWLGDGWWYVTLCCRCGYSHRCSRWLLLAHEQTSLDLGMIPRVAPLCVVIPILRSFVHT